VEQSQSSKSSKKGGKSKNKQVYNDSQTLFDIWRLEKGEDDRKMHYNKVIEYYTSHPTYRPFITVKGSTLYWNGKKIEASAFIEKCRLEGFVARALSGPRSIQVLNRTFKNLNISQNSASEHCPGCAPVFHLNKFKNIPQ
jgi:hypothetical protein